MVPAKGDSRSRHTVVMTMHQASVLWLGAVALLFGASTVAEAAENFARVTLPQGVSIDLPINSVVLSNNQRITLDTAVEAGLDLSGVQQETSDLPFAANYYDDRGNVSAILNIRYYSDLNLSQADARSASDQDIQELDAAIKENLLQGMEALGMSITSWDGTSKAAINGIATFVTEYSRASLRSPGDFRVKLVRVFAEDRSFTLTASYLDSAAIMLRPITDRIIASLRLTGVTPVLSGATESPSAVSGLNEEHWPLVVLVSAIATWGIGLGPPLLIRFVFMRRPIGKAGAIGLVTLFWIFNIALFTALGSQSNSHGALALVAFASYAILRRGSKKVAASTGVVSCGNDIALGKKHV
jgi:hypothetical protein